MPLGSIVPPAVVAGGVPAVVAGGVPAVVAGGVPAVSPAVDAVVAGGVPAVVAGGVPAVLAVSPVLEPSSDFEPQPTKTALIRAPAINNPIIFFTV